MRKKNLLILIVVVFAGVAGVFYTEHREKQEQDSKYTQLAFNSDEFQKLEIKSETPLTISRTKNGFTVNSRPADKKYLDELFESLKNTEFEKVELNDDLTNSLISVDMDQRPLLIVSQRKNFESHNYFRIHEEVFISNTDLPDLLSKPAIYYQQKHLFDRELNEFSQIKIKSLNENFTLKEPYEKDQVNQLLNKLKAMTVQNYLTEQQAVFEKPILQVELIAPIGWRMEISLNRAKKKLFAKITTQNIETFAEYDTSYWEYFANLNQKQFMKDKP